MKYLLREYRAYSSDEDTLGSARKRNEKESANVDEVKGVEDGSTAELRLLVVGRRREMLSVELFNFLRQPVALVVVPLRALRHTLIFGAEVFDHRHFSRLFLSEATNAFFDVVVCCGVRPPRLGREPQAANFFFNIIDLFVHVVREAEFVSFQVRKGATGRRHDCC